MIVNKPDEIDLRAYILDVAFDIRRLVDRAAVTGDALSVDDCIKLKWLAENLALASFRAATKATGPAPRPVNPESDGA